MSTMQSLPMSTMQSDRLKLPISANITYEDALMFQSKCAIEAATDTD
jgi:hypothetical protein